VIRERIAEGGMGAVYVAFDPQLGRKIALKFVRVSGRAGSAHTAARARLLREAHAIAQLAHPNVIAVHDVGTIDDNVFIAMELVEGTTLREWLKARSRSLHDTLAVMIAAGRGLAAAHAAGLVHRDFKPSNVLVGNDGRVRIVDFGLARTARSDADADATTDEEPDNTSSGRLCAQLTVAGSIVGTPPYMSPEQFRGANVDVKSDQYSFAVTLFEAVHGEKPFRAESVAQLEALVREGTVSPPTNTNVHVPGWLRRVIARGMAVAPEARYPTMDALLAELSRDHARGWRRAIVGALALAVLGSAAAIAWTMARGGETPCAGANGELVMVWNPAVRLRMQTAFAATGRAHAVPTFARVAKLLDARGDAWVQMRTAACRATRVLGEQSEAMLDLRMRCLDRRLAEIHAVTDVLAATTATGVDRAVDTVLGLEQLDACADPEYVTAAIPPPTNPARVREIARVRERLDRSNAVLNSGDYRAALDLATLAAADAKRTDYAPVIAEAALRVGWSLVRTGDAAAGVERLDDATVVAASSKADVILAEASLSAFYVRGVLQAHYGDALAQKDLVLAIVARAGDHPAQRADALSTYGYLLLQTGAAEAAVPVLESARALFTMAYGSDHPRVAHALNYLAMAHNEAGRYDDGRAALEQAVAIWERAFGSDHPMLISGLINLASTLAELDQLAAAKAHASRALSIAERLLGADHPKTATALAELGDLHARQGECEDALPGLARSVAIFDARSGANHPSTTYPLITTGRCLVDLGRPAAAIAPLERALVIRSGAKATPAELATPAFQLARALWDAGTGRRRAVELARQARASLDQTGASHERDRATLDTWLAQHRL
jgi:eukaryotic-like serine/threonine-protein kinase